MKEKDLMPKTVEAVHTHTHTSNSIEKNRKNKLTNNQSNLVVCIKHDTTGITLVALVVTIVVLLILAGITLMYTIGENGIINKTKQAKEAHEKAAYEERIRLIGIGLQPDRTLNGWDNQEYMNVYAEKIREDNLFLEAEVSEPFMDYETEKITIRVITKEGWIYWITEDNIELRKTGEIPEKKPTEIWAALEGNTLRFYTKEENARKNGGKVYENVKGKTFTRDNTAETVDTPWFVDKDKIKAAEFVDEVAPEYMAYFFSDLDMLETVDMRKVKIVNVTDMYGMFLNCHNLKEVETVKFNTSKVENMGWMFLNCSSLTKLDMSSFDTTNVTNMEVMFNGCSSLTELDVSGFNTSNVTTMRSMFANMTNLQSIDVSIFDTKNVTNMATMFYKCTSLTKLDLSNFDTSKTVNMNGMFSSCESLTILNVSNFDTKNVTNMATMFYNCTSLTNLDLSNFDTTQVMNMQSMFARMTNLKSIDVSNFNTKNVTNMTTMFYKCTNLTRLDLSNLNTSQVTTMQNMFNDCESLTELNISNFDMKNITNFDDMFFEVKNDIAIITNSSMKIWLNTNYPAFNNIITI